jgi:hypothetical protein
LEPDNEPDGTVLMTQTVDLPNGDSIDFPDGMSQDDINAAVKQHLGGAASSSQPSSGWWNSLTDAVKDIPNTGTGMAARTALRVAPPLAIPTALGGAANTLSWLGQKYLGMGADQPLLDTNGQPIGGGGIPSLSDKAIKATGLEPTRPQSTAAALTESALPFLMPNANTAFRVAEAPGKLNKGLAFLYSEGGGVADWIASTAAQEYARQQGWSDQAQQALGFLGASARSAGQRVLSPLARLWGAPDAGERFDIHRNISPTVPTAGTVGGPTIQSIETGLGSIAGIKGPVKSAQRGQDEAIANYFNQANQRLSPGVTPTQEAGPVTMRATGGEVKKNTQALQHFSESTLKPESDALLAEIDPNRRLDATPVLDAAENLATDPNAHPDVQAAGRAIYNSLVDSRNVNPIDGTISFDALKTQRTDLKTTLQNAFPAITGDPSMHPTIGGAVSQVKDAMTAALDNAAADAGRARGDPTLLGRWQDNDASWRQNARMQDALSDFGGKMERPVQPDLSDQKFADAPTDQGAANQLKSAVLQGDQPVIDALHQHLSPGDARSAVAETLASTSRPAAAGASGGPRMDLMGNEVGKALGPPDRRSALFYYVNREAPGAAQEMSDAAAAGRQTGRARTAEGLGETFGAVQTAVEGAKRRPWLWAPLVTMLEDPSFVRSLAGRSLTDQTLPPLLQQYAIRAAAGAIKQPPAVTQQIGGLVKAAPTVASALMAVPSGVASTIANYAR